MVAGKNEWKEKSIFRRICILFIVSLSPFLNILPHFSSSQVSSLNAISSCLPHNPLSSIYIVCNEKKSMMKKKSSYSICNRFGRVFYLPSLNIINNNNNKQWKFEWTFGFDRSRNALVLIFLLSSLSEHSFPFPPPPPLYIILFCFVYIWAKYEKSWQS